MSSVSKQHGWSLRDEHFKCSICNKEFSGGMELKGHALSVHQDPGYRAFNCLSPGCDKNFLWSKNRNVHMLIHSGVMPYACEHCDYRCRQKSSLNHHLKTRHCVQATNSDHIPK